MAGLVVDIDEKSASEIDKKVSGALSSHKFKGKMSGGGVNDAIDKITKYLKNTCKLLHELDTQKPPASIKEMIAVLAKETDGKVQLPTAVMVKLLNKIHKDATGKERDKRVNVKQTTIDKRKKTLMLKRQKKEEEALLLAQKQKIAESPNAPSETPPETAE